ncbi:MAG: hypothetical protein JWP34_5068 [Massilia sp.]|jgi:hypothetical protein|nr:hypothetical protein [Massilia sp.]
MLAEVRQCTLPRLTRQGHDERDDVERGLPGVNTKWLEGNRRKGQLLYGMQDARMSRNVTERGCAEF